MSVATGIMVYVVLWWLVLFTVLPWGVRPVERPAQGHEVGAPERPRLVLKFAVTTVVAGVIFAALYWFIDQGFVSFRQP